MDIITQMCERFLCLDAGLAHSGTSSTAWTWRGSACWRTRGRPSPRAWPRATCGMQPPTQSMRGRCCRCAGRQLSAADRVAFLCGPHLSVQALEDQRTRPSAVRCDFASRLADWRACCRRLLSWRVRWRADMAALQVMRLAADVQVGGDSILKALSAAEYSSPDAEASAPILHAFTVVIR